MKSNPALKILTISLLALGLILSIPAGAENRYPYPQAPQTGNHVSDPATATPPERTFWQRFARDLKNTGRDLGRAFNRTRDELNYSFHNSTTELPRSNNLNRHQKRFSGHVRTRNEAQSIPYQKPPALVQRQLSPPSLPAQNRAPKPIQGSTQPPRPPVEIVRPNEQPATKKQAVSKPPAKPKDTTTRPAGKNEKPPARLTPPPPKETVVEKKPEANKKPDYPLALKTENTGFVKSPYPPFALLDVRDIKPGGLAMEPDSDRIFRLPK